MTSPLSGHEISGRQVAAARALTGIGLAELARAAGLTPDALAAIEADGSTLLAAPEAERLIHALERFGVVPVGEGDGLGAGVRLKFTRTDTRQLGRLEGEGGRVAEDDVP